jgi:hypothetical protein
LHVEAQRITTELYTTLEYYQKLCSQCFQ